MAKNDHELLKPTLTIGGKTVEVISFGVITLGKPPCDFTPLIPKNDAYIEFKATLDREVLRSLGIPLCQHCADRDIWRCGLLVTFIGRPCWMCIDECLQRGITMRFVRGGKFIVCRKF